MTLTVWGNVATQPMHVVGPSGTPRTTFRLAHTPRHKKQDGSYGDGPTSFFNVTCFGYLAVNAAASLSKGTPVVLVGDLTVREWQAGDGRQGRDVDLVAAQIGPNLRWGRAVFERPARAPRPFDDQARAGEGLDTSGGASGVEAA
ncbi:MAG TPA: single-stranded DNA-binding protein [Actinomycetales bacterium]|nr:single-stranded DNA-binding protein [Actinomycetales bacterium]